MGKILVEYEELNPTSSAFISAFGKVAEQLGIEADYRRNKDVTKADLVRCDIVLSNRANSSASYAIAVAAKSMGRKYFIHYDDDFYNFPKERFMLKERQEYVKKCLSLADAILAPNPILAKMYAVDTQTRRYVLVNTPVNEDEIVKQSKRGRSALRIVYAAGKDHAPLFEKYVKPSLPQLFSEFGEGISFTFIGVSPDVSNKDYGRMVEYIPLMSFAQYRRHMATHVYSIGLAPLHDDPFSSKKYFNKFIEYSLSAVFGIYSDCLPYTLVVKNEENGILVQNTAEGWLNGIRMAVKDQELRDRCVRNAQDLLRAEFNTKKIAKIWSAELPELVTFHADKDMPCTLGNMRVKYSLFSYREKLLKALYYCKVEGISMTMKKIFGHFIDKNHFSAT